VVSGNDWPITTSEKTIMCNLKLHIQMCNWYKGSEIFTINS